MAEEKKHQTVSVECWSRHASMVVQRGDPRSRDIQLRAFVETRKGHATAKESEGPFTSQNISSVTRHIKSLDPCMEH
jgi:hypothetical protein